MRVSVSVAETSHRFLQIFLDFGVNNVGTVPTLDSMNNMNNTPVAIIKKAIEAKSSQVLIWMLEQTEGKTPESFVVEAAIIEILAERHAEVIPALDELEENWQTDDRSVKECVLDTMKEVI